MRKLLTSSLVTASAVLLTACGGGSSDSSTSLPVVNSTKDVTISFAAQANGTDVKCGAVNTIANLGTSLKTAELQDLRFYIADVKLINNKGEAVPVNLTTNINQNYGVALLDFEDATGACATDGTPDTYTAITGKVNEGTYTGIQFLLGVPDTGLDSIGKTIALSHSDVMAMKAPLDVMALGWSWQAGRKFVKIELNPVGQVLNQKGTVDTSDDAPATSWFVHLGATGCTDAKDTTALYSCTNPNTTTIKLASFDYAKQKVVVDLSALFANSDISLNQNGALGCMSGVTDGECPAIFNAFGINLATGQTSTTQTQSLFKVSNK